MTVEKNEGISVEEIANTLDGNFKTISPHTRSLVHAGLLNKKYRGRQTRDILALAGRLASSEIIIFHHENLYAAGLIF